MEDSIVEIVKDNIVFQKDFVRTRTKNGMSYTFKIDHASEDVEELLKDQTSCFVEGETIYNDDDDYMKKCNELPEETKNPLRLSTLFTQWLKNCSGVFVRPPTLTQCLANTSSFVDGSTAVVTILPEEEDHDWILVWVPTILRLQSPHFHIGWAPVLKKKSTRIPLLTEFETESVTDIHTVKVVQPEVQLALPTRPTTHEWPEELKDLEIPFVNSQTLRLHDVQQEKMRKRIHEARIRAKLARYRAERLAQQFERKYGVWPEEDQEEAQTEIDSDSENSDF